jgi:hypothetical protein
MPQDRLSRVDVAESPDECSTARSRNPDRFAACAAHALALRTIIRCQQYEELEQFEGGVGDAAGEESLFYGVDRPNGFYLGEIYRTFMNKWIYDAGDGGPAAREVYVDLVTTILADEMTGAEGLCSDDMYHALILLAALKSSLWEGAVKEAFRAPVRRRA